MELTENILNKIDKLITEAEEGKLEERNILVNGNPQTPSEKYNRINFGHIQKRLARETKNREDHKETRMFGGRSDHQIHKKIQRDVLSGKEKPGFFLGQK